MINILTMIEELMEQGNSSEDAEYTAALWTCSDDELFDIWDER